jgi:hypothetical protein
MSKALFNGAVTDSSTVQEHDLGTVVELDGKKYRYVQVVDLAAANGNVVEVASASDPDVVSIDRAGGSSIGRIPRGVAVGAIAANSYGWIQISGYKSNITSDGSVSAGEALVPHASTNGSADSVTASTTAQQVFGYALADDTTSAVQGVITLAA